MLYSTPGREAATLFSYRNKRYPAIQMHQFMHIQPCRVPTKEKKKKKKKPNPKTTTIICHSTPKHQFTEDLFPASHHSFCPGWFLGRPSLKGSEPSRSFILLGHVWQDRSKDTDFCFLTACSPFSDPEGEKTSAKSMCCHTDNQQN